MGFNFGAFVGGASDNLVNMIKTKEAQLYEEQKDEKERLREARVEATRKRQADEEEAKGLMESLSLFYSPDQVKDIMANGKAQSKYAINHGEYMAGRGLSASASYSMPKVSVQSEFTFDINDPRGSQVSSQMAAMEKEQVDKAIKEAPVDSTQPFISRFTQPPREDDVNKSKTFEARLVELDFQRSNAKSQEELDEIDQAYNTTLDSYVKFKKEISKSGVDTSPLGMSKSSINATIDGKLTTIISEYATKGADDRISIAFEGNEGVVFPLMGLAIDGGMHPRTGQIVGGLKQDQRYGDPNFQEYTNAVDGVELAHETRIQSYIQNKEIAYNSLVREAADNNAQETYESLVAASGFVPIKGGEPRSIQEIEEGRLNGLYKLGQVVEYQDENGTVKTALVADLGLIFY